MAMVSLCIARACVYTCMCSRMSVSTCERMHAHFVRWGEGLKTKVQLQGNIS